MPCAGDVFLEEHIRAAERRERLALGLLEVGRQLRCVEHDPHSAPTAAVSRLEHDRIAQLRGQLVGLIETGDGMRRARQNRHPGPQSDVAGGRLVAQLIEQFGPRADEADAGFIAGAPESRILGEEAIAGMNGVDLMSDGDGDDAVDIQIGADRLPFLADAIGFVGFEAMQGEAVFVGIDGDRPDVQFMGRAKHANRDFTSIGDQQLPDRFHGLAGGLGPGRRGRGSGVGGRGAGVGGRGAGSREQGAGSREQGAGSREQGAESREQRAESREQRAESREQRAGSRE